MARPQTMATFLGHLHRLASLALADPALLSVVAAGLTRPRVTDRPTIRALRTPCTTKAVGQGTGLGLWISHNLISQQNGRIEVESQLDRGTTVSVFLPNDQGERDAAGPDAHHGTG